MSNTQKLIEDMINNQIEYKTSVMKNLVIKSTGQGRSMIGRAMRKKTLHNKAFDLKQAIDAKPTLKDAWKQFSDLYHITTGEEIDILDELDDNPNNRIADRDAPIHSLWE